MMEQNRIEEIHDSLVNGNRAQAAEQIADYGAVAFFEQYRDWLNELDYEAADKFYWMTQMALTFARNLVKVP